MIDVKQAVQIAKAKAAEILGQSSSDLEEIERDSYKEREVWSITLSVPRAEITSLTHLADPVQYRRFLIDANTGELVAMKLREVASQ
ncbi:MAG TPA: PepSY domain-containing protein [Bryobacteraceae bacterium]|nr:PepSY domain-containing protein [Bryobacteraceae bacterium]